MHDLDFGLLPTLLYKHTFMQLQNDTATGIASLTKLSERANNSIRFAHWSSGTSDILRCSESEVQQLREGCFRAALTEFSSMEDVQKHLEIGHSITTKPLLLNATLNPLLHLFRELRNLEVHLKHSGLRSISKEFYWGTQDQANAFSMPVWILDGVTPQSFSQLRNSKNYTVDQIERMVSWLNETQEEWGIQEIFLRAVEEYCKLLKVHYFP